MTEPPPPARASGSGSPSHAYLKIGRNEARGAYAVARLAWLQAFQWLVIGTCVMLSLVLVDPAERLGALGAWAGVLGGAGVAAFHSKGAGP